MFVLFAPGLESMAADLKIETVTEGNGAAASIGNFHVCKTYKRHHHHHQSCRCDKWMGSPYDPYDRAHLGDYPPRVIETMWGTFEEPECIEPTNR